MNRPQPPFNVLIVEDEAVLAMDLEAIIEDCGHKVFGEAMALDEVEAFDQVEGPDLAFVDLNLARGSSGLDVCAYIRRHWPETAVIFVTANPKQIPGDFCGAHGVIPKPFSRSGLLSAMRFIEQGLSDPPPSDGQPASFFPAAHIAQAWSATR
jgi:DNA-binding response OmpR family regulator